MTNPNPNKQQIPGGHALQKAVSRNYLLRDASDALRENVPNLGQMGAAQLLHKLGRLMSKQKRGKT